MKMIGLMTDAELAEEFRKSEKKSDYRKALYEEIRERLNPKK